MIEHISLRCRDADASRKFYERALAPLGYIVDKEYEDAFGVAEGGRHDFWVTQGKVGTPTHLAFHADAPAAVDAFYRAALGAGGKDNGPPGPREQYGYAAFVFDPDGHNVEAVIWDEELRRKQPRRKEPAGGVGRRGAARKPPPPKNPGAARRPPPAQGSALIAVPRSATCSRSPAPSVR